MNRYKLETWTMSSFFSSLGNANAEVTVRFADGQKESAGRLVLRTTGKHYKVCAACMLE